MTCHGTLDQLPQVCLHVALISSLRHLTLILYPQYYTGTLAIIIMECKCLYSSGKSSERGLISVVSEWMNDNYDDKNLWPCWCSVVCIVADEMGGDDPRAARTIAKEWKS